eukprot:gene14828-20881_t
MNTTEYLNMVLQTRGPQATPYAENVKYLVRDHLTELQKVFPTLAIKVDGFHGNDGSCQNLLKADGTIPIHYQGAKYNLPINIWLLDRYPYSAPLVYVVPTPNMVIKGGHHYVDSNGQVSTLCLKNWSAQGSNLVETTLELSHVFGLDPPLYSGGAGARPPPQQPPPQRPPPPQQPPPPYSGGPSSHSDVGGASFDQNPASYRPSPQFGAPEGAGPSFNAQYPGPSSTNGGTMPWGAMFAAATGYPAGANTSGRPSGQPSSNNSSTVSIPQPQPPPPPPPQTFETQPLPVQKGALDSSFRDLAIPALTLQLVASDSSFKTHSWAVTDELLEVQRSLSEKKAQLGAMVDTLRRELSGTEGVVQDMASKSHQLRQWLDRNEPKAAALSAPSPPGESGAAAVGGPGAQGSAIDVKRAIEPVDNLTREHIEAQAEDLAIEDVIVSLDNAFASRTPPITVENYIKQERGLCRRQFFARARANQSGEALRQAEAASSFSGPRPSGSRPSHGGALPPPPINYPQTKETLLVCY